MQARDLILSPDIDSRAVERYLQQYGFRDALVVDQALQRMADLVGARERFAALVEPLLLQTSRAADPEAAWVRLESFLESVPGRLNLLAFLEENPHALEVLSQLLGGSSFLSQILIRNPEYLYWLLASDRLQRVETREYFETEVSQAVLPFQTDPVAALEALRRMKRRESLRIGGQDLMRLVTLEGIVGQVSQLAEVILEKVFQILASQLLGAPEGFAVIALGKLGGGELNFSSDIDVLYVFRHAEDRAQMVRFAREYTRSLSELTGQGRLYRVDLRLRPMGQTGEIAYPIEAYRQYQETWADTFDRLALIKCRQVAGDRRLGEEFVGFSQDFIFKKYLDSAALEEIRWLKRKSDRRMRERAEDRLNIKLGLGGIREIEFFVQTFQILYGGSHPEIRTQNTLLALDRLVESGFIPFDDYELLRRAYRFLRDVEHKLQLVHDLQTHTLPRDDLELARLARRMGFFVEGDYKEEAAALHAELESVGHSVRRLFDSLFETGEMARGLGEIVLNPQLGREAALERLKEHQVEHVEEFYEGIRMLQEAPAFPQSPTRLNNLLANLLPLLAEGVRRARSPAALFTRFDRLCEAVGTRASLYSSLIENGTLSQRLFSLLGASDYLAETLIRNPELLDSVFKLSLAKPSARELRRLAGVMAAAGHEPREALRLFQARESFKIALLDLFPETETDTRRPLSRLAEICLEHACEAALVRADSLQESHFSILALGKLGGEELTHHSDLDLILVYDDRIPNPGPDAFHAFLKEIRHQLEEYTSFGKAYTLDFRLRPEGKHGPPATPLSVFLNYLEERAEAWERLAYAKLRPVFSRSLFLEEEIRSHLKPFSDLDRSLLRHIRHRKETELGKEERGHLDFKVGRGGLMDVQFVTQYLQIQYGIREPNTRKALVRLKEAGHLAAEKTAILMDGLEFLCRLEALQRLLHERPVNRIQADAQSNCFLARHLGFDSGESLLTAYRMRTEALREIYHDYFP